MTNFSEKIIIKQKKVLNFHILRRFAHDITMTVHHYLGKLFFVIVRFY
jgi:hypothetical protein